MLRKPIAASTGATRRWRSNGRSPPRPASCRPRTPRCPRLSKFPIASSLEGVEAMVRRLFVTGGAGFLGSAVVRIVIAATDWEVMNIERMSYARASDALAPGDGHPRYRLVRGASRAPDLQVGSAYGSDRG